MSIKAGIDRITMELLNLCKKDYQLQRSLLVRNKLSFLVNLFFFFLCSSIVLICSISPAATWNISRLLESRVE